MSVERSYKYTCDNCGRQEEVRLSDNDYDVDSNKWWSLYRDDADYDLCSDRCVSQFSPPTEVK